MTLLLFLTTSGIDRTVLGEERIENCCGLLKSIIQGMLVKVGGLVSGGGKGGGGAISCKKAVTAASKSKRVRGGGEGGRRRRRRAQLRGEAQGLERRGGPHDPRAGEVRYRPLLSVTDRY